MIINGVFRELFHRFWRDGAKNMEERKNAGIPVHKQFLGISMGDTLPSYAYLHIYGASAQPPGAFEIGVVIKFG